MGQDCYSDAITGFFRIPIRNGNSDARQPPSQLSPHLQIPFDATDDGVADGDVTPRYVSAEFDRHYSVDLDCSDHARYSDLVTWSKDGRELHDSADYSMPNNGAVLTVRNVGYRHAGRYECRVVDAATEAVTGRQTFILVEAGLCCSIACMQFVALILSCRN